MRVGYYQFQPEFGLVKHNLKKVEITLSGVQADIIVLPELAFTGYLFEDRDELQSLAEDISDSPTVQRLTKLSTNNSFHLVTGFAERKGEKLYNSALVIGPSGVVHCYRKLHLFNTEKDYFDPGDTPLDVVEIAGVKVGIMVCFDWIFPEVVRTLALKGADLICHPSNLVLSYCQKAMLTRSLENSVYSITANRTGMDSRSHGELSFTGRSQLVGPRGEILESSSQQEEEVVLCDIDISQARDKFMTERNDLFLDRRPSFYRT